MHQQFGEGDPASILAVNLDPAAALTVERGAAVGDADTGGWAAAGYKHHHDPGRRYGYPEWGPPMNRNSQ